MTIRQIRSACASGIALLVCTAVTAAPRLLFDGAAHIHNLERITVVYPAGTDQDVKTNRDSADLRAAYLRERFEVDAAIAADDAVTPEQLQGNLLVLGWENRLLGTAEAPRPFTRDNDSLLLLGQSVGRPTDDLLLLHTSPFNPESVLVFWSRIDPELDRFWAFPLVGADWAVFRGYFPAWLGMFRDSSEWPPTRNAGTEQHTAPYRPPALGESEHYVLHHGNHLTDEEAAAVLRAREAAFAKAAERIGDPGDGFQIHVFVYEDSVIKEVQTGVPDALHSVPRDRELHLPKDQALVANPHEEYHLLADALLGPCTLTAMYEGLAVSHEGRPGLDDLGVYAAMMDEAGSLPGLESLLDDERLRKLALGGSAFQSAALLVQWIQEVGGTELLAAAYTLPRGDAANELARRMDLEPGELEPAFHAWLRRRAAGALSELAYHRAMDDAATAARAGESETYLAALRLALESLPDDPDALYQMGVEEKKRGQSKQSKRRFSKVTTLEVRPDQLHLVIFSHFQLGQLSEQNDDAAAARRSYRRMLEMPDRHGSHRMARESLAELPDSPSD